MGICFSLHRRVPCPENEVYGAVHRGTLFWKQSEEEKRGCLHKPSILPNWTDPEIQQWSLHAVYKEDLFLHCLQGQKLLYMEMKILIYL
jgi:hypothetical protein